MININKIEDNPSLNRMENHAVKFDAAMQNCIEVMTRLPNESGKMWFRRIVAFHQFEKWGKGYILKNSGYENPDDVDKRVDKYKRLFRVAWLAVFQDLERELERSEQDKTTGHWFSRASCLMDENFHIINSKIDYEKDTDVADRVRQFTEILNNIKQKNFEELLENNTKAKTEEPEINMEEYEKQTQWFIFLVLVLSIPLVLFIIGFIGIKLLIILFITIALSTIWIDIIKINKDTDDEKTIKEAIIHWEYYDHVTMTFVKIGQSLNKQNIYDDIKSSFNKFKKFVRG